MKLSVKERQALKARAHSLKPVVMIGSKGLTEAVLAEAEIALDVHELIKIKLSGDRQALADTIPQQLKAELVQLIGNMLIIYRKNPEK